jgi:hypothetical protein
MPSISSRLCLVALVFLVKCSSLVAHTYVNRPISSDNIGQRIFKLVHGAKMIELSPEDLKFRQSAEFPGVQTRTNIHLAASALETRKLQAYPDPRLINLGTIDFLMAVSCGSLYPTKPPGEYREDLAKYLSQYVFKRITEFEGDGKSDLTIAYWMRRIARKIELNSGDIKFKDSQEFHQYKEQIKRIR